MDYCVTWARIVQGELALSRDGVVVQTDRGAVRNPWATVLNQYRAHYRSLIGELGLSPSAASRLSRPESNDHEEGRSLLSGTAHTGGCLLDQCDLGTAGKLSRISGYACLLVGPTVKVAEWASHSVWPRSGRRGTGADPLGHAQLPRAADVLRHLGPPNVSARLWHALGGVWYHGSAFEQR